MFLRHLIVDATTPRPAQFLPTVAPRLRPIFQALALSFDRVLVMREIDQLKRLVPNALSPKQQEHIDRVFYVLKWVGAKDDFIEERRRNITAGYLPQLTVLNQIRDIIEAEWDKMTTEEQTAIWRFRSGAHCSGSKLEQASLLLDCGRAQRLLKGGLNVPDREASEKTEP